MPAATDIRELRITVRRPGRRQHTTMVRATGTGLLPELSAAVSDCTVGGVAAAGHDTSTEAVTGHDTSTASVTGPACTGAPGTDRDDRAPGRRDVREGHP